jgi:hypothetical protein
MVVRIIHTPIRSYAAPLGVDRSARCLLLTWHVVAAYPAGEIYRAVPANDGARKGGEPPVLAPGHQVFVLHAADGSAILLAESREAAIADAENNQLETVSVPDRALYRASQPGTAERGLTSPCTLNSKGC